MEKESRIRYGTSMKFIKKDKKGLYVIPDLVSFSNDRFYTIFCIMKRFKDLHISSTFML